MCMRILSCSGFVFVLYGYITIALCLKKIFYDSKCSGERDHQRSIGRERAMMAPELYLSMPMAEMVSTSSR